MTRHQQKVSGWPSVSFLMRIKLFPDLLVELLQTSLSDVNKSRRESFLDAAATGHEC